MTQFRKLLCLALCAGLLICCIPLRGHCDGLAQNISGPARIEKQCGFGEVNRLFDGDTFVPTYYQDHAWITLQYSGGIGSLYLIFHFEYGAYSMTNEDTGETVELGQNNFLHDFVDVEALFGYAPKAVTLHFDNGILRLNELYIFSPGQVPDFVQRWEPPAEGNADLVLFSAHGDDEQLYMLGIVPYYAGELEYRVQVVYLTNHRKNLSERCHEMLNGLYTCGARIYPIFGPFDDQYSEVLEYAYLFQQNVGVSKEELLGFVVEQIRRFQPAVAVTHDIHGEYGHGQHQMYADLVMQAVQISMDPQQYPELAQQYGVWDVPKTYLHLYPENPIVMDWDAPLERFGGLTAYQVSRDLGFPCHITQRHAYSGYFWSADTASEVIAYNPCYYGLYRSTVGQDVHGGDFFENIPGKAVCSTGSPEIS